MGKAVLWITFFFFHYCPIVIRKVENPAFESRDWNFFQMSSEFPSSVNLSKIYFRLFGSRICLMQKKGKAKKSEFRRMRSLKKTWDDAFDNKVSQPLVYSPGPRPLSFWATYFLVCLMPLTISIIIWCWSFAIT